MRTDTNNYSALELLSRSDHWRWFVKGVEDVLLKEPQFPLLNKVDYLNWADRKICVRRAERTLELFDVESGETVRAWLSSHSPNGHPIRTLFVDAIMAWTIDHNGNPLGLASSLEGEIGPSAKAVMTQFDHADELSETHAQAIIDTFQAYLIGQIEWALDLEGDYDE